MKHSTTWGKRVLAAAGVAALAVPALAGTATAVTPELPDSGTASSLTIHKYATKDGVEASKEARTGTTDDAKNLPSGATPLDGAVFEIQPICYKNATIDLTKTAGWEQAAAVTGASKITGDYSLCGEVKTETTKEGGVATFSDLTKTLYKVTEKSAPTEVKKLAEPFVVTVPLGKADGTWIYDVHVYPKNSTADKPKKALDTSKSVLGDIASDSDKAVWTLTATVPALSAGATAFKAISFEDTLAEALGTVDSKDFAVSMTKNGDEFTDFNKASSAGKKVVVTVDPTKVKAGDLLVVTLTTDITGSGAVTNSFTFKTQDTTQDNPIDTPSDETTTPTVNYGSFKITKTDASSGAGLNGVVFKVCEANAEKNGCKDANFLNTGSTDPNTTGTELTTANVEQTDGVVTGTVKISEGAANAEPALATNKDICVVETGPLDGYIVNDDNKTTCFTVSTANTTAAPLAQSITNVKNTSWNAKLPVTGAQGLVLLVLGGAALVAIAAGSALVIRRRQA